MQRPELTRSDINLRIFVDTNVLIDYTLNFDERKSRTFLELFKTKQFENIELVTSDYVLWEFYGHFKEELYIRKLISDHNYGHIGANRECRRGDFKKASLEDMKTIGETIESYVGQFEEKPVSVERLIENELPGFSNITEKILLCSKFSYKDAIVFSSALFTRSHMIITLDETFSSEQHLEGLKEALENLRDAIKALDRPIDMEFCKPADLADEDSVKKNYREWFLKYNKGKQLGNVIGVWPRVNVIGVECLKDLFVEVGDYLCLTKFYESNDFMMKVFEVTEGNLKDYDTEKDITKGSKVTIKLPPDTTCESNMQNSLIFLYSA